MQEIYINRPTSAFPPCHPERSAAAPKDLRAALDVARVGREGQAPPLRWFCLCGRKSVILYLAVPVIFDIL